MADGVRFNINDKWRIKLTDRGREIWDACPASKHNKPDEDGCLTEQAWEIMHVFGPALYNGCILPFEVEIIVTPIE